MFSAVSSAFIIDIYKQLQPDPTDQSAALLRAILLTLNHSAIPNETPAVPATQQNPPSEIVLVNCLLFASLLMSLLAAFAAMLGKQWLNRYSRHAGGSMIERCGDRQRKFDGLQRWRFYFIIESLPVMLQIALLLLACGLCRYIMTINTPVAWTLIILTGFGVVFYLVVAIVGASSYECPFQTPGSAPLRNLWKALKRVGLQSTPIVLPVWGHIQSALVKSRHHFFTLSRIIRLGIHRAGSFLPRITPNIHLPRIRTNIHLPHIRPNNRRRFQSPPLPTTQEVSNSPTPDPPSPNPSGPIPRLLVTSEPANIRENTGNAHRSDSELVKIQKNADNVRCVSWVLKDITDPETLDAAIQLAGTIWWFEGGIDVKPIYDLCISTFDTCFGSDRMLRQGSRNRAYHSGRAIIWIHALAVCKSEELAQVFHFPARSYRCSISDDDLWHLMVIFDWVHESYNSFFELLLDFSGRHAHAHLQWTSSVLLHLSWATQTRSSFRPGFIKRGLQEVNASTPLDLLSNILLVLSHFLGSPVEEEMLKIQDKSYGISCFCFPSHSQLFASDCMKEIVKQVARAIDSAPETSSLLIIWGVLHILSQLKKYPFVQAQQAYGWCIMIWRNRNSYEDWKNLLLLSLEVGIRDYYSSPNGMTHIPPTGGELHQGVYDTVLESNNTEAVIDLVWASLMFDKTGGLGLSICADYIIDRRGSVTEPSSQHLRSFFTRHVGSNALEKVGKERSIELFNLLHTGVEEMSRWQSSTRVALLLRLIRSTAARRLAINSWELLEDLAAKGFLDILSPITEVLGGGLEPLSPVAAFMHGPDPVSFVNVEGWNKLDVATSLMDAEEWDKLKCWMSIFWMVWPVEAHEVTKELEDVMEALEKHRPGAVRKQMERWNEEHGRRLPEPYQQAFDNLML